MGFTELDNGFATTDDPAGLQRLCEGLGPGATPVIGDHCVLVREGVRDARPVPGVAGGPRNEQQAGAVSAQLVVQRCAVSADRSHRCSFRCARLRSSTTALDH